MKISIIDIGTQSLKHYIFDVVGTDKKLLHYKRYSESNLGESETLSQEVIDRNVALLEECFELNKKEEVSKLQILGTEILRKAQNAKDFTDKVKEISGHEIQVISQDKEAEYLYDGFVGIVPENFSFAAMNIGGGSTEVVVGDKSHLADFKKIPFGAKFLKKTFFIDGKMDWSGLDAYLAKEIRIDGQAENIFVTGVLDFITPVGAHLGFEFQKNDIPNHPIKFTMDAYVSFLNILRNTSIDDLKKIYSKDPGYCENFAIGQSVYISIARKLSAKTVIPSNNDLTDGVVYEMTILI